MSNHHCSVPTQLQGSLQCCKQLHSNLSSVNVDSCWKEDQNIDDGGSVSGAHLKSLNAFEAPWFFEINWLKLGL